MFNRAQPQPTQKTTEILDTFIKNNRRFIKISEGDVFRGIFHGLELVTKSSFGEMKEVVVYKLQENGSDKILPWENSRMDVAIDMKQFVPGQEIIIKRTGSGPKDTSYDISAA